MNALTSAALVARSPRKPIWEREDGAVDTVAESSTDACDGSDGDGACAVRDLEDLAMQMFDAIMAGRRR